MTDRLGEAADAGPGSLAERANQALLVLADLADQKKSETELSAIATACTRAEELTSRLEATARVAAEFEALGVPHNRPQIPPSAAKAISNLRAAATRAGDPGQDLTERLRGGAVQEALKVAATTAKVLEQALTNAADVERLRVTPSDLNSPVATMPGSESLHARIRRIQSSLAQPYGGLLGDLPAAIGRWRQSAMDWAKVREELTRAVAGLPPEIKAFVEAAATNTGAPWSLVTAAVREWLDTDGHGEGYEVRKW